MACMKLTIFGAIPATGKHLLEKALQAGHEVTAFVRDEAKVTIKHERLKVLRGDALDPAQVEHAVQGSDAVLSTLEPKGRPALMAAESTKNIVSAMQKYGVRRLVVVSVAGIPVPQDQRGFDLAGALVKLF
jgi:putative NADH-flavin reductase